jgi:hypothetical protein
LSSHGGRDHGHRQEIKGAAWRRFVSRSRGDREGSRGGLNRRRRESGEARNQAN